IERPRLAAADREDMAKNAARGATDARTGTRPVWFGQDYVETPIYRRDQLAAGVRLAGPAVIEEFGSTTVVLPGLTATVDRHGILIIREDRHGQ
ncbi:MAG: hypothetical protein AAGC55_20590, partial [Myxococcota bacterium]